MATDETSRIDELEGRVQALELRLDALTRIVAASRPLENMLESFGATNSQEKRLEALLDELASRGDDPRWRPSCSHFLDRLYEIFPEHRTHQDFADVLVDTLAVERAAYRKLHEFIRANEWPVGSTGRRS